MGNMACLSITDNLTTDNSDSERVMKSWTLLIVSILFLAGCPDGSSGPTKVCTKAAEQCQMGGGKLGVCTMDPQGAMTCMSQH